MIFGKIDEQLVLFMIPNSEIGVINWLEYICTQIQKEVLDKIHLHISSDFRVFSLSVYEEDKGFILTEEELIEGFLNPDISTVLDWNHINFKALGISRLQFIDSVNDFIANHFSPYQSLDYPPQFVSSILSKLLSKIINSFYPDRLFKFRLKQAFYQFVYFLEQEPRAIENHEKEFLRSRLSMLSTQGKISEDCTKELLRLITTL